MEGLELLHDSLSMVILVLCGVILYTAMAVGMGLHHHLRRPEQGAQKQASQQTKQKGQTGYEQFFIVKGRIFSGVQPTGNLHLGNYLGAIRNWVELQDAYESIYCVVDLHAITVPQDPAALRQSIREVAASLIASGIDPKKSILFNQSRVPHHTELGWIFNCVARLGWLNRMTQFKEKAGKNRENATVGLYAYPTLMAADILVYKATHVPVGEDQKQHLELTRDIALAFNSMFETECFPAPEPLIQKTAARVMSLRDGQSKMSKSDSSDATRINLTDSSDILRKIKKAKQTEPLPETAEGLEGWPEARNLVGIFAGPQDVLLIKYWQKGRQRVCTVQTSLSRVRSCDSAD